MREKTTAPELAERFEVSRRTINRDIEDLCKAGIPIKTAQGTGGGISIMDGYRMDRTILSSKDMQMILAGLRSLDSVSGSRYYSQLMEKIPIVFCCDKVDYRKSKNLPDNALFLDKPIVVSELTETIDHLLSIKNSKVKKLEFRNQTDTIYLTEDQISYAWPKNNRQVCIHTADGGEYTTDMSLASFCGTLNKYDNFVLLASNTVLNMRQIRSISMLKVTMQDGKSFRLGFGEAKILRKSVDACMKKPAQGEKA